MLYPKINWKEFDKNNPPLDLDIETQYLIFLRKRRNEKERWNYWIDVATPYGHYLDDFWDTENYHIEGQNTIEILAYAELGYVKKTNIIRENKNEYEQVLSTKDGRIKIYIAKER